VLFHGRLCTAGRLRRREACFAKPRLALMHKACIPVAVLRPHPAAARSLRFLSKFDQVQRARRGAAMTFGEGASGFTHLASAIGIGKQDIDLGDQIVGIAD
jgi:hypothetical protein